MTVLIVIGSIKERDDKELYRMNKIAYFIFVCGEKLENYNLVYRAEPRTKSDEYSINGKRSY